MPQHLEPDDLQRLGPEARRRIADALAAAEAHLEEATKAAAADDRSRAPAAGAAPARSAPDTEIRPAASAPVGGGDRAPDGRPAAGGPSARVPPGGARVGANRPPVGGRPAGGPRPDGFTARPERRLPPRRSSAGRLRRGGRLPEAGGSGSADAIGGHAAPGAPGGPGGPAGIRVRWLLVGGAVAALLGGVAILVGLLVPHGGRGHGPLTQPTSAGATTVGGGTSVAATGQAAATQTGRSVVPDARVAKAAADASTAATSASAAATAASRAQALVAQAKSDAARAVTLSAPSLARRPGAQNPAAEVQAIGGAGKRASADIGAAQRAYDAAAAAAHDAEGLAAADAAAGDSANAARADEQRAAAALSTARAQAGPIDALATQAQAAAKAWARIHSAPPGYFGLTYQNPPTAWGLHGCEILSVDPGSPAQTGGLVGAWQRTDPVGDVITLVRDATDGGAAWKVPDCSAFDAARLQTRRADHVTLDYFHRQVVWYDLSGRWVPQTADLTLGSGPGTSCPAPVTGTITPAAEGNRIQLTITLSGPSGGQTYPAILDTGATLTLFPDAYLRAAGYTPASSTSTSGIVPGAATKAYVYHLPGSAIRVSDRGLLTPLAKGTLTVLGVPGEQGIWLGPDILKYGAKLTITGSRFTLAPPC